MISPSSSERRRPHLAVIWIWAVVTVLAGPVLIFAQLAAALGSFGGPGSTPVADATIPIATVASLLGGVGAFVIGGRWWTALLAGSPGLLVLLTGIDDPVRNLFALMLLASPIGAIIGVGLAVAHANETDDETEDGDEIDDEIDDATADTDA